MIPRVALIVFIAARRPPPALAAAPRTTVPYALLIDFDTGATLFAKNADAQMSPASTTKILTAEIVFHALVEGRLHLTIRRRSRRARRARATRNRAAPACSLRRTRKCRIDDLLHGLVIDLGQ